MLSFIHIYHLREIAGGVQGIHAGGASAGDVLRQRNGMSLLSRKGAASCRIGGKNNHKIDKKLTNF